MSERTQSSEVARLLGVTPRTVIKMANNGYLPGAGKIGGRWTFDREKLRKFVLEREQECQRKICISATEYGGYKLPSVASSTEDRFTQAMLKLRGKSATN